MSSRSISFARAFRPMSPVNSLTSTLPIAGRRFVSSHAVLLLQALEQAANKNLASPAAQLEFYNLLLQNNYPQIVCQRYETPGIASDPSCTQAYITALNKVGQHAKAAQVAASISFSNPALQAPISGSAKSNYGSKEDPVHVVVSEHMMAIILRWIKWLVPLAMLAYAANSAANFLEEHGSSLFKAKDDSPDKLVDVSLSTVRFTDVHGCDEARAELEEIVDFLRDPAKFTALGGKLPKGILLTGPPGTGKTLLARATAGEAGVPFFFMSGSEFDEMYVGVGAKRIRELFKQAREKSPAIIFIDELDAIGGKRNPKDQAYAKQTLNQLLVELDGFSQTSGVIVIGATNFPESLDKALTRPGRFDKEVNVDLPDVRGRVDILRHHMRNVETAQDVDPLIIARGTPGLSGAELMNLVNQAAVHALQLRAPAVDMHHFDWAKDKILMGAAKKHMVITEELRKNTAYHEAGHAIMAMFTEGATPLYKATILPRGRALGVTFQLPEMDKVDMSRKECLARLDVCMGGKVAEEMLNGKENVTSGCLSDLSNATGVARAMVTSYGMSDKIGPVRLSDNWESWLPQLRNMADTEVRDLLVASEERTREVLRNKKAELGLLAEGLIEYETLTRDEMEALTRGDLIAKSKRVLNTVVKEKDGWMEKGVILPTQV